MAISQTHTSPLSKTSHFHSIETPLSFSASLQNPSRRHHVRAQQTATSRAAAAKSPVPREPIVRIGRGSARVRLRLLRRRGAGAATIRRGGDGRVGSGERGQVGPDRAPRSPTTRVRRAALEASGSPSHFHGQPRPPRAPPSLLSLQAVNEGKLVPEEIIFTLLSRRLEEGYCRGETGFILDGVPRTRMQAEILDQIADIDLVVNFKCTEDHLLKNNLGAGNFSPCREYLSMSNAGCNLNLMFQNKELNTSPADIGGPWKEKFHIYSEQSKPLEDYYRKQQKLLDFHVASAPGETWQGLLAALHLQHINAVSSSQKLTA
ncbi:probable adenylate kinase 7, mitochondrial isoform X1 [Corylus avellana]|uniref:probable adenylate kinase 7, mitochondrial isoform X1 n=1 Tax=Corylus avellana TaxID=13451 RepID=UPI00286AC49B|nr:probable adenylate kinase 7, mitochondrial isoform X1 [Corylus avellana]